MPLLLLHIQVYGQVVLFLVLHSIHILRVGLHAVGAAGARKKQGRIECRVPKHIEKKAELGHGHVAHVQIHTHAQVDQTRLRKPGVGHDLHQKGQNSGSGTVKGEDGPEWEYIREEQGAPPVDSSDHP
jgi:hypothetical protein